MAEQELEPAVEILTQILEDKTVPKNIRENAQESKDSLLNSSEELSVRIDQAVQLLDEISEDPNMPVYTRTQIWSIVSMLEGLLH
jgi:uncharacterized protein (UPF0147 family)